MALDLTAEQRKVGKENFDRVTGDLSRRGFLKSMAVAGGVAVAVTPAVYFGYKTVMGKPVKTALIGGGDEGGVLIGAHNPDFLKIVAVCDIRPSNQKRIMDGEPGVSLRPGLTSFYKSEAKDISMHTDYLQMLEKVPDLEAVIIALPLHLHAPVAIDCMRFGQQRGKPIHVLCEKLMAWNIRECKRMIDVAKVTGSILSIGHQRHYSMLYAHAKEVMNSGVLGDVKHIRALWHRNNSWPWSPSMAKGQLAQGKDVNGKEIKQPFFRDGWCNPIYQDDYEALVKDPVQLNKYGFESIDELIRWRLYNETGGGLMAELGSHQLDACSIFLGKVHPLAVQGVGGKFFYGPGRNDRDSDDGVFVTYEFPGKNHPRGPNKGTDETDIVVVTYTSVNTNSLEQYGECVMGSRGTMIVEGEASVMLYPEKEPGKSVPGPAKATEVSVTTTGAGKPALDASSTWGPPTGVVATGGQAGTASSGPISRGYKEEMEDFAYCIRQWDAKLGYGKNDKGAYQQRLPLCHGEVAMADAIVALTANQAMSKRTRIEFLPEWFDADKKDNVPDDPKAPEPKVKPRLA